MLRRLDAAVRVFQPLARPPAGYPLFPYTTLFRSRRSVITSIASESSRTCAAVDRSGRQYPADRSTARSEEHTSELQSRENLVCRLLLEKKNYLPHAAKTPSAATSRSDAAQRRTRP